MESPFARPYRVATFDVGPDKTLRLSAELKLEQEIGEQQLATENAGLFTQLEKGMAFVMTRTRSRILRAPRLGETITLCTWPKGTRGSQFLRCYEFMSEEGELLISSVSAFVLVSPDTHRILRPSTFYEAFPALDMDRDRETVCPDPCKWSAPESAVTATHRVTFSQVDWNGHLNNTEYADLLTDHMQGGAFGKRFTGFEIEFLKEAYPYELLSIRTAIGDGEAFVGGSHERGECFRARATFASFP